MVLGMITIDEAYERSAKSKRKAFIRGNLGGDEQGKLEEEDNNQK